MCLVYPFEIPKNVIVETAIAFKFKNHNHRTEQNFFTNYDAPKTISISVNFSFPFYAVIYRISQIFLNVPNHTQFNRTIFATKRIAFQPINNNNWILRKFPNIYMNFCANQLLENVIRRDKRQQQLQQQQKHVTFIRIECFFSFWYLKICNFSSGILNIIIIYINYLNYYYYNYYLHTSYKNEVKKIWYI